MKKSNEPQQKVTREVVARTAGVSTFTVSQALRGMPGVAEKTRAHVEAVAAELGYQINPVASLLAGRNSGPRGEAMKVKKLVVAFLTERDYSETPFMNACALMGLVGQIFHPSTIESPEALSRILWSRGVHGILISDYDFPWGVEKRARVEWSKFSAMKLSRSMQDLPCHLVRHSAYDFMIQILKKVLSRGFRRIAVLMMETPAREDDESRLGAFLAFRQLYVKRGVTCQRRMIRGTNPTKLDKGTLSWLEKYQPDAIVVYHWTMVYPLQDAGYQFPGPVGLAAVITSGQPIPDTPWVSGNDNSADEMMERAMRMLQEMVVRGERGFAEHPLQHVIDPVWIEGETLGRVT